jgi:hypothetical protein
MSRGTNAGGNGCQFGLAQLAMRRVIRTERIFYVGLVASLGQGAPQDLERLLE